MSNLNLSIQSLPPEVFLNQARTAVDQTLAVPTISPIMEELILPPDGGIYVKYQGIPFLKKGFPYPAAIAAVNEVKRLTMFFTSFASKEMLLPALGFIVLPFKYKLRLTEKMLFNYCRVTENVLGPHFLKSQYNAGFVLELHKLIYYFLVSLGISYDVAARIGRVVATLLEYDDAYQMRAKDLLSTTNQEALFLNPRAEVNKIIQVLRQRDIGLKEDEVGGKFIAIGKMLSFILLLPRFKKAFRAAVKEVEFTKLQMDDADKYWSIMIGGYNFFGQTLEVRTKAFEEAHKDIGLPTFIQTSLEYK